MIRLWDLRTGTMLREFRGHRAAVRALAFSPSGDQLASGAEDNSIRLWWLVEPRVLTMRQDTWVHALAYSPDGRVLITVPAFPVLWTHHDDLNYHFVRYRKRSLAAVLEPSGLMMISSHYCFHWLVPVKLAVRAFERVGGNTSAPTAVPAPWLNRLLFALTRVEQRVLGGLDLPFGSSLLAWCAAAG